MRALIGAALALAAVAALGCGGNNSGPTSPSTSAPIVPPGPVSPSPGPPVPSPPQIFVGAGDIGWCGSPGPEQTARLIEGIGGTVFTAGDNAYFTGSAQDFQNCYDPSWGRFKARTRPVPGNHEYESGNPTPYFDYFGTAAGPAGLGYYSFPLGDWHAVALNSNIPIDGGSGQAAWLRADLTAANSKCTLVYWHHPLFTSGPNGGQTFVRDIWRILYEFNVELVINGHDHLYERFAPQDPNGRLDAARGIRQFTVGTGGASLYPFAGNAANSEKQIQNTFGVLKLTLQSGSYQWDFLATSGPGDGGSGSCH
jgi:hypothetical protein